MKKVFYLLSIALMIGFNSSLASSNKIYDEEHKRVFYGGITSDFQESRTQSNAERRSIYLKDLLTTKTTTIFRSERPLKCIKISPKKDMLAAIEIGELKQEKTLTGQITIRQQNTLIILTDRGELLHTITDNVRKYVWNLDGTQIVYINGDYYEGGFGFLPKGVYIFDLPTKQKRKIAQSGYDVSWAKFNNKIYIYDITTVDEFNPRTNEIVKTKYKGIYFSPSGEYYFKPNYEEAKFQLYERKSNNNITTRITSFTKTDHFFSVSWSPREDFLLVTNITDVKKGLYRNYIFDVAKKALLRQFNGRIAHWGSSGEEIIMQQGQKINLSQ